MHVKRLYNALKAGHTGTLDPLASGLLPLCFGEATKFAQLLLDAPKCYRATIRFGVTTTTQDAEGEVVAMRPVAFDAVALEETLRRFTGPLVQVPPAHSALKFEGRPYYEYARRGITIPRAPRAITIHALRLVQWQAPIATLDVECSKGTYVRALAAELGETLDCGAHLAGLRRTASGGFELANAVTLDALDTMATTRCDGLLLPVSVLVKDLPRIDVDRASAEVFLHGQPLVMPGFASTYSEGARLHSVFGPDGLLGIADVGDGIAKPRRSITWASGPSGATSNASR